jgi:antitoxin component YwqK of YwqJK toxin-antitoxin module
VPAISLNIPYFQRKVTFFAEKELSKYLQTPVEIKKIEIDWLNRISIKDLKISDKDSTTVFEANNLTAGFKLFPALKNKWVITTIRLFGFSLNLTKETPDSKTNLEEIIKPLLKNRKNNSGIDLRIHSILLRRGNLSFHVLNKPSTKDVFNPNHVNIKDISGNLSLNELSKDSIHAEIGKLSFAEMAGFTVKKMAAEFSSNKDSTFVKNFVLTLPYSTVYVPEANISAGLLKTDSFARELNDVLFALEIDSSHIVLSDFKTFSPELQHFINKTSMAANLSGTINSMNINNITINDKALSFAGDINIKNLWNKNEDLFIDGQIKDMKITIEELISTLNKLSRKDIKIPKPLMNMNELQFIGDICGYLGNMQAQGALSSSIGSIQTNMMMSFHPRTDKALTMKGYISSSDLQINKLFEEGNPYGIARFEMEMDLTKLYRQTLSGNVTTHINEVQYKGYNYENIYLSGQFKNNEYEGVASINDPNGKLSIKGLFRNDKQNPVFDFEASLTDFRPDKLNLSNKFKNPVISLNINAMFDGNNPDDFNGFIDINDLAFHTEKDRLNINNLHIKANSSDSVSKQLSVSSDIINGEIKGNYSFSALFPDLLATAKKYAPALIHSMKDRKPLPEPFHRGKNKDSKAFNDFDFYFTVNNTDDLTKILNIPVSIIDKSVIKGHYSSLSDSLETEVSITALNVGKTSVENINLRLRTNEDNLGMHLKSSIPYKNNLLNNIDISSYVQNDSLKSTLLWTNNKEEKYEAEINVTTLFLGDSTAIAVQPAPIIIKDSIWSIAPASAIIENGHIHINNFLITKNNQYIRLDGTISKNPREKLLLDLKDIEISYIFDIINTSAVRFGGKATGKINARDLPDSRMIEGRIEVQDFSFNDAVVGKLNLSSEWDDERQGILLLGTIYNRDSTWTDVNGYIFPVGKNQGLSLYFDANNLNIAFLHNYLDAFSNKVSGQAFGNIHLYGSFSDVCLEGSAFVRNGNIGITLLNTDYSFSDSIRLDKNSITTENTVISDKEGNTGTLTLNLQHNYFRDLKYDLGLAFNKMLVYDITQRMKPEFYGKVYASGTGKIDGTENFININANARSEAGTSVGFNFMEHSTAEKYDFITFVGKNEKKDSLLSDRETEKGKKDIVMDYMLDFMLNATPDATFELILDPLSGDKIQGNGNGNLHVLYGKRNDLQMFGNFNLMSGIYNFSLQQLIHKRFNIHEESTVSFNGDPLNANLGIVASYNLTANIQDLDEALVYETANTNIPVNCILNLDGALQNPTISFDLQLPNSNSELERQVRSFIDTEDMMTRQIIYLLALNKFYTPDYSHNDFRTNEFSAVASSALSAQLSSILSNISDKVQIGTNIRSRQDGIKDTEVEMILSSRLLNNRLLFNGNFGYKDNDIQQNAFIGEFDLEYKLNRNGEISLKAYNHANDLYHYTTKSLTRQGVGVIFKKDFSTLSEIFRRRRKSKL